ncbi:MAG: DUF1902 domain-containing protein [Defluviitaleaceae bacterium]|nr:DUF1902 domain-containing protein [Defluviitaleaceae bacterium]
MDCKITLLWDSESDRWYTKTDDVPGMALDSGSIDALIEKVRMVAPDMLEANMGYLGPIRFTFAAERTEIIREAV